MKMIFAFLLLLQLTRYNVEGKHFLVETKDGGDQRKVCKINVQCYVMVDHHQVGNDYHNEKLPENLLSYGLTVWGNTISIEKSPTLRFLLKCGHLAAGLPACSDPLLSDFTQYIYTQGEVLKCVFVFVFVFVCM